ncbi:MerR family transcriptional regulator [Qipengyuania sp. JC766]|uniref:MerR family transcriptional regulator n=1 Tax=Qipengyuania sp. JC766 TaxID=3232139 RepID=UPI00345B0515
MDGDFEDGKERGALRTIGEVSSALGIKPHVLRYWEQQFPMLDPLKRSGGRRYYRSDDVRLVATISRLVNDEGYTLKGALAVIEKDGADPAPDFGTDIKKPFQVSETGEEPIAREPVLGAESDADREPGLRQVDFLAEPIGNRRVTGEGEVDRAGILAKLKSIRKELADAIAD